MFIATVVVGCALAAMYLAAGLSKAIAAPRTVAQAARVEDRAALIPAHRHC